MQRRCPVCGSVFGDEIAFCGHDGNVTIRVPEPGETADPRLGEQLGNYIVAAHVADGAMGAVYEARNAETRERVAIKVLHPDVEQDEIAVERFHREYETADMFDHPHIVRVKDFGVTRDGQHYLTMEFLVGKELGEILRTEGKQRPARALRILAQVAEALDYAHSFGVIHRDLKPDNIYVCATPNGDDVRLLDFGSVKLQVETGQKLTAFGTTLGSPYYMSPEQAKGLPDVDNRTDVFAIGAILYEALSGFVAFQAPTVAEILMKIVRSMPAPIHTVAEGLPPKIHAVIEKAIAKKKEERYADPKALVDAALDAFGVEGGCSAWADRPEAELEAAIAAAGHGPAVSLESAITHPDPIPAGAQAGASDEAAPSPAANVAVSSEAAAAPPAGSAPTPPPPALHTSMPPSEGSLAPGAVPGLKSNRPLILAVLGLVALCVTCVAAWAVYAVFS
ncbi:MAG: serine/threonine protein kinase [Sandaracinaceae bacterium]